jgi:DNA polymerase-4
VGPKTESRLISMGFQTIGDVRNAKPGALEKLGDLGRHLAELSRGVDTRPVVPNREPKSIGAETTFDEDTRDRDFLVQTIRDLAERVGRRLRKAGYRARQITLKLRYADFDTHTRQATAARPIRTDEEIAGMAIALFERFPLDRKVRLLGVSAADLSRDGNDGAQMDLFAQPGNRKLETINDTIDRIREKFGESAIQRARRS